MNDDKERADAADAAPRPRVSETGKTGRNGDQDAPHSGTADDGGPTIPLEDMNSANDE